MLDKFIVYLGKHIYLNPYRFYRKAVGGKWAYNLTSLPMPPVWMPAEERCGCFLDCLDYEDWSNK